MDRRAFLRRGAFALSAFGLSTKAWPAAADPAPDAAPGTAESTGTPAVASGAPVDPASLDRLARIGSARAGLVLDDFSDASGWRITNGGSLQPEFSDPLHRVAAAATTATSGA